MQGAVLIHLKGAKGLPAADSNGLSDPYAVLKLGKESKKSMIQYDTLNPMWNEKFEFVKVGPLLQIQRVSEVAAGNMAGAGMGQFFSGIQQFRVTCALTGLSGLP